MIICALSVALFWISKMGTMERGSGLKKKKSKSHKVIILRFPLVILGSSGRTVGLHVTQLARLVCRSNRGKKEVESTVSGKKGEEEERGREE